MIRFILLAFILISFLILSIPILIYEHFLGKKNPQKKNWQCLRIVQFMFRLLLRVSGVSYTVEGLENIPRDRAVLYVGNHRSYFDILLGYVTVPGLTGFVAKKEMDRYPSLREWMKNVNCLFLDRHDLKEGLKTILKGIDQVKRGISVWIFPEGTRNTNEKLTDLLPYKEGSLKIAEKSGCPVIPVAMVGTADIFEKHIPFIRKASVKVRYGKPIYLKELPPEKRKFSGAYVRDVIIGMLEEMENE